MPNLIPGSLFNYSLIWMRVTKAFSFEPMLCESIEWPPEGNQWHCEPKFDGFRAIGHKAGRSSQLWSRNHKDFCRRFRGERAQ
jgi:ATP-dependent DNA ligase